MLWSAKYVPRRTCSYSPGGSRPRRSSARSGEGLARRAHEDEVVLPGGDLLEELRPDVIGGQVVRARAHPGVDDVNVIDRPTGEPEDRGQPVLSGSRPGEQVQAPRLAAPRRDRRQPRGRLGQLGRGC
eukprot:12205590-Alexandrium_andersonii.AAC.1